MMFPVYRGRGVVKSYILRYLSLSRHQSTYDWGPAFLLLTTVLPINDGAIVLGFSEDKVGPASLFPSSPKVAWEPSRLGLV